MTRIFLLFIIITSCSTADPDRTRRMKMSEMSYASGCYQASIHVCEKYVKAPEKFSCYEEMNGLCPDAANRFRDWLEKKRK